MKVDLRFIEKIRTNKYSKVLASNIIQSFSIKGLAMVVGFLMTPTYIKYFDNNVALGVWFTMISMFGWILDFDLGIGNGLRTKLVRPIEKDDKITVNEYISSAYILLAGISIIVLVIGMIASIFIDWNIVFNISKDMLKQKDILLIVIILYFGIILQFLLKLITSVLFAMQKTALPSLVMLITNVALLIFLNYFKSSTVYYSFLFLSIFYVLSVNLPLFLITIVTFKKILKIDGIKKKYFRFDFAKNIFTVGGTFFFVQSLLVVLLSTNQILISWYYSPEYVVEYQIYNKMFYFIVTLFSLLTQPMWSAFSSAYVNGKISWIIKVNKLFYMFALLGVVVCLVIAIYFQPIVELWLGNDAIEVNVTTSLSFVLMCSTIMFINASTALANAANKLKVQFYCLITAVIVKIVLVVLFSSRIETWSSIILFTSISMLPLAFIQPVYNKRLLEKRKQIERL